METTQKAAGNAASARKCAATLLIATGKRSSQRLCRGTSSADIPYSQEGRGLKAKRQNIECDWRKLRHQFGVHTHAMFGYGE